MNRIAQLGKLITVAPVLIIVLFILGAFLIASSLLDFATSDPHFASDVAAGEGSVFLGPYNAERSMTLFDAIYTNLDLRDAMNHFLISKGEDNHCLVIVSGRVEEGFIFSSKYRADGRDVESISFASSILSRMVSEGRFSHLVFTYSDGSLHDWWAFYGGCNEIS